MIRVKFNDSPHGCLQLSKTLKTKLKIVSLISFEHQTILKTPSQHPAKYMVSSNPLEIILIIALAKRMATWAHPSRWVLPLTNVNRSGSSYFGRHQNMRHILLAKQHTYLPLVGYSKLAIEKALKNWWWVALFKVH